MDVTEAFFSINVIAADPDGLRISVAVQFDGWAAREKARASRDALARFAAALVLLERGGTSAEFRAGDPDTSWAGVRLFEYSRARRLAMEVHLGSAARQGRGATDRGSEFRLTVPVERGQLATFAADLNSAIAADRGATRLRLPPRWL